LFGSIYLLVAALGQFVSDASMHVRTATERALACVCLGSIAESAYPKSPRSTPLGGITQVANGERKLEKNARGAAGRYEPYFSLVFVGLAVPALTISYLPYAKYGHKVGARQYRLPAGKQNCRAPLEMEPQK
jgi:hypothetical protein